MSLPTLLVEVGFADNARRSNELVTWTDITAYVRSFSTRRGRQHELDRIEAGTATVVLSNADRRFDPEYTAGPYYGNLLPMKKVRISATWAATTYRLFLGNVDGWPQSWIGQKDAMVTIRAVDAFKGLNFVKLNNTYVAHGIGVRLNAVLDDIGWPSSTSDRSIDSLLSVGSLTGTTNAGTPALQHFQDCTEAVAGYAFIAGSGVLTLHDRRTRLTSTASDVSQGTFGDAAGELGYTNIELSHDDALIYNEVRITASTGTEQIASDTTSQNNYYQRTLLRSGVQLGGNLDADTEALRSAQWYLAKSKDPATRIVSLTLAPTGDDNLWPHVLGREISHRVTVTRRPQGVGTAFSQDGHIESIAHDYSPKTWRTTWQLSKADTPPWMIFDSTRTPFDTGVFVW